MRNVFFRKFVVVLLVLGVIVISFVPRASFAQSITSNLAGCSAKDAFTFNLIDCIIYPVAYILDFIFTFVGWIVGILGNIFSYTLGLTINNQLYQNIEPVATGWAFTRDIVNIFFIFALLFIAIATILGIESHGAKALLPRLIIIALLVNFSLLATQAIIFVTNALAYELYSVVNVTGVSSTILSSYAQPNFNRDIAGAIMRGIQQQRLFNINPTTLQPGPVRPPTSASTVNIAVLVTLVASIFIMAFAGFIFLAGSFFFIVRMAVLWILMVLAPFGFVFLILPATKGYAQKWWTTLQSQALFAPAFMFFIIITVKMSNADLFGIVGRINSNPNMGATDLIFLLIIQSTVIFLLLGGSLVIAKSLGIYGAGAAISMATNAGKAFRGYAGKLGKRAALTAAAPAAAGISRTWAGRIPIIGGAARTVAAAGRKSVEDYQKGIEKYTTRELKQAIGGPRVRPVQSAAIMQELVKRGDVSLEHGLTERKLRGTHTEMRRLNMNTRDLERLWPELAVPQDQADTIEAAPTITRLDQMNRRAGPEHEIREAARRMRPADIEKLDESIVEQPHTMEAIASSLTAGTARGFVDRGGRLFTELEETLRDLAVVNAARGGRIIAAADVAFDDVADALEYVGNRAGANFMRRGQPRLAFGFGTARAAGAGGGAGGAGGGAGPGGAGPGAGAGPGPGAGGGPAGGGPGGGGPGPGAGGGPGGGGPGPGAGGTGTGGGGTPPPSRGGPVIGFRGTATTP